MTCQQFHPRICVLSLQWCHLLQLQTVKLSTKDNNFLFPRFLTTHLIIQIQNNFSCRFMELVKGFGHNTNYYIFLFEK